MMSDLAFGWVDWVFLVIAGVVTLYVIYLKNPHEKKTKEYFSFRVCKLGFLVLAWSYAVASMGGLLGLPLAVLACIFGVMGVLKGRRVQGALLIIGAIIMPILRISFSFQNI